MTVRYSPYAEVCAEGPITVLGDLHGKLATLEAILSERRVEEGLAKQSHWLISVGDLVDRGPRVKGPDGWWYPGAERVLDRLAALRRGYPRQVHVLMGNHELQHVVDIAGRTLEPGDVSQWGAQGRLRLTPERIEFLQHLPVALRLGAGETAAVVVHGGPPREAFELSSARLPEAAACLFAPGWHGLLWANPAWSLRAHEGGPLFTTDHVRRFLELNRASVLIRGHRDEDELRSIPPGFTFLSVHSAKGARDSDDLSAGYSYIAWDPPDAPRLVRR